jgi:uncharacterized protein (TIGR03435 family)
VVTPVVNDTGLDGYYDFTAWLSPERGAGLSVVADSSGARHGHATRPEGVIVAVREQLGLTLQQRKAPVEVFVIDHAAKPEANWAVWLTPAQGLKSDYRSQQNRSIRCRGEM